MPNYVIPVRQASHLPSASLSATAAGRLQPYPREHNLADQQMLPLAGRIEDLSPPKYLCHAGRTIQKN